MKVDLHTHSSCSDGELTPTELVCLASSLGVEVMALTDHDTVSGVKEAMDCGEKLGITVISGIELSAIKNREVHILGYGINCNDSNLKAKLQHVQDMRENRNQMIVDKLCQNGINITMDMLKEYGGDGIVGRSHIAQLMVKHGYATSVNDAFDRFIGNRGKYYVSALRLTPEEAVKLILRAGGIPVLAHPNQLKLSRCETEKFIRELKDCGLVGIEGYYYSHGKKDVAFYKGVARKYGLILTGGSDYHGKHRKSTLGNISHYVDDKVIEFFKGYNKK